MKKDTLILFRRKLHLNTMTKESGRKETKINFIKIASLFCSHDFFFNYICDLTQGWMIPVMQRHNLFFQTLAAFTLGASFSSGTHCITSLPVLWGMQTSSMDAFSWLDLDHCSKTKRDGKGYHILFIILKAICHLQLKGWKIIVGCTKEPNFDSLCSNIIVS